MKKQVYIYKSFERFWHWAQAALISLLMFTGFEIHGSYKILGFENAVNVHNWSSIALMVLIVFTIFWHFTTGEWKQYIPTLNKLVDQVKYYTYGIFHGHPHPVTKTVRKKMNPLQVITYLGLKLIFIPLMVFTGLLYMLFRFMYGGQLHSIEFFSLDSIAFWHTLGAYFLVQFVIVHVYMTTTGHTVTENIKAMITGYEEIEVEEEKKKEVVEV
ncbi:cytochrome b/b6 domain-containing protein [Flammeovirga yaeyamensis]|uniref:Cytochrome b/b6 domain-containing protein n=1 Tax=Flammeovirga yaeyamensis TaxID=367791 RepID=A0AAX1NAN3_9BACT|nr:cytochrome b/b6 domain-containing protein [Flammeovirga yaeyamensis]MBB3700089.1 thiosulfate reductase cytochrome b subunit [Flammeovirga yaeyamensis]NMF37476.1 cytochrome B [Flammeovirga yaeyamensis]QWG04534.1 cytochrome b/b6 domain-containing protein [Flammeovirga yaeyamensis]